LGTKSSWPRVHCILWQKEMGIYQKWDSGLPSLEFQAEDFFKTHPLPLLVSFCQE